MHSLPYMIKILLYFYCSSSTIGIHTIVLVKLMKRSAVRFEFLITHCDHSQFRIAATSLVTWRGREFTVYSLQPNLPDMLGQTANLIQPASLVFAKERA